ncbi:MAG: hypothetical protein IMF04_00875 [Proteobacteria bacterium]|nr:hypothetical protein [Pseudomonadota bacterium]
MRKLVKLGSVIAISAVLVSGLTACGGGLLTRDKPKTDAEIVMGQEGRTLWESKLQYVKIVDRDVAGLANDHPVSISAEEMRTVLSSLYVGDDGFFKKKEVPLFAMSELHILSTAVANGLSQASPGDDINFVSIGSHQGMMAKEAKTTTGRIFMSGGRLNVIFGLVHENYSEKDKLTGQQIDRRLHPLLPGKRKFESDLTTRIALDKGQSLYLDPETGKERADWLIIDVATVLAAAAERTGQDDGKVSPELLEDVARSKQEASNLRDDVSNIKAILFEMSDEIEALKKQLEAAKAAQ